MVHKNSLRIDLKEGYQIKKNGEQTQKRGDACKNKEMQKGERNVP